MSDKTYNDLSDGDDDPTENIEDEVTELDSIIRKDLFDNLEEMATPMKLTRQSVDHSREHMKVYLRVRPFTEREIEHGESQDCLTINNSTTCVMRAPKDSFMFKNSVRTHGDLNHKFTFTNIFRADTSQKKFFDETMLGVVKDFVDGQNCLVFTYGVTNAGKTYTIQGTPQDEGILPRSLDVVFNSIEGKQYTGLGLKPRFFSDVVKLTERQIQKEIETKNVVLKLVEDSKHDTDGASILSETNVSTNLSRTSNTTVGDESNIVNNTNIQDETTRDSDVTNSIMEDIRARIPDDTSVDVEAQGPVKFAVWVSFAEIYNEYIYDLLEAMPKGKKARRQTLKLSEDKNGSIYIKGLKEIQVSNADEAYKVLTIGQKNQRIASTKLNHCSSRSHCIFSIKVLRVVDIEDPHVARVSKLSFCDLAGSERYTKTQNTGDRLKEAGNINTSLLTLGKCITTLRYNQNHPKAQPKIIPFRESKLTRLFQSFFLGKGKASMIVNVNQCASLFDETSHVMKFSAIAKQVTTVTSKLDNKWKEVAVPKPASARNVSLAIQQGPMKSRATIGWATPARDVSKKAIHEIVIDEDDEEDDTVEEESVLIETGPDSSTDEIHGEKITQMMSFIANLQKELLGTKQEMAIMEAKIREEVCQEMAQQLVDIESTYSERLKEERMIVEEKCDKRIEMYTQSVKKTRKRARIDRIEDEDDEWVSSVLFHAEQVKVQERNLKIKDLSTEVESLQATVNDLKDKAKRPKYESIATQADIGNNEEVMDSAPSGGGDDTLIAGLKTQITDHKDTIMSQQNEITDLQEMLTEAGETFHQQNGEIEKLKLVIAEYEEKMKMQDEAIKELEKSLQENTEGIGTANLKLKSRDNYIQEIEKQLEKTKDSSSDIPENQLTTLQNQLQETRTSLEKKTSELESLKSKLDVNTPAAKRSSGENILKNKIATLEQKLQQAQETIEEFEMRVPATDSTAMFEFNELQIKVETSEESLKKALMEKEEAVKEWKNKVKQMEDALTIAKRKSEDLQQEVSQSDDNKTIEIANLKEEKNVLLMEIEQMKTVGEESKSKITKLEASVKDYQTALNDNENFLEQLNKQEKSLKTELETEKKSCDELKEEVKVLQSRVKQLVQNVAELDEEKKTAEIKVEELTKLQVDSVIQTKDLQQKLLELQQELETKEAEKQQDKEGKDPLRNSESQTETEDGSTEVALEEELEKVKSQLESMVQNSTDAVDEIKKELSAKTEQIKVLEVELEQVNMCKEKTEEELQVMRDALKGATESAAMQQQKVDKLETDLTAVRGELKQRVDEITTVESKLSSMQNSEKELETRLETEVEKLRVVQELADKSREEMERMRQEMSNSDEAARNKEAELIKKCEDTQESVSALQESEKSSRKLVERLEGELEEAQKKVTDLETECEQLRGEQKEFTQMKMKDSELKKELRAANRSVRKAEEKTKEQEELVGEVKEQLKKNKESLAAALKEVESLQKMSKDKEDEVKQIKKSTEEQIGSLQEIIEKEKEVTAGLEKELSTEKDMKAELEKQIENLKEEKELLDCKLSGVNDKTVKLESDLETNQALFHGMKQQLEAMESSREQQERKIEELVKVNEESQESLRVKKKELAELQEVSGLYQQLHNKHAVLETQADELRQHVKTTTENNDKLQADLVNLNREFAEEIVRKDTETEEVKKELERAKKSLTCQEDLCQDLDKANEREKEARQEMQKMCSSLKESNHTIDKHMATIQELRDKIETFEKQDENGIKNLKEHEEKIEQLKEENVSLQKQIDELKNVVEEKDEKVKNIKSNEKLIESLKCAIEEQESTMAQQDAVLSAKEEEMKEFLDGFDELQDKHSILLKSSHDKEKAMKKMEGDLTKVNAENSKLKETSDKKDGDLEKLQKTVEEMETERKELKENVEKHVQEVKELEMQLKNTQAELEELKENKESLPTHGNSKEADELKRLVEEMQSEKEKELKKWRDERDKLVAALEKELTSLAKKEKNLQDQLKERDCHITELIAQLEKETAGNLTDDESDKIEDLEQKLKSKADMVKSLENKVRELEKAEVPSVGSQRATRSGRPRRGTAISTSDDTLAKEIESLRKELSTEKICVKQTTKAVEAKDYIIEDLKAANQELQAQLSLMEDQGTQNSNNVTVKTEVKVKEEVMSSSDDHLCDEVISTPVFDNDKNQSLHMEIDVTPLQKKQPRRNTKTTRGGRKRKGTETSEEGQENAKQPKQDTDVTTKTRRTGRRGKTAKEAEPDVLAPSLADNIKVEQSGAFSKFGDYLQNSPFGKSASTHSSAKKFFEAAGLSAQPEVEEPESPPRPPPPAQERRRGKKKLYKTDISAPLELSHEPIQGVPENKSSDSSHSIVARRLRSRTTRK